MRLQELKQVINQIDQDVKRHPEQLLSMEYLRTLTKDGQNFNYSKMDVISDLMDALHLIDYDFIIGHQIEVVIECPTDNVDYLYDYYSAVHSDTIAPLTLQQFNDELLMVDLNVVIDEIEDREA